MAPELEPIEITSADLRALLEVQDNKCALTGLPIEHPGDMSLDHINPRKLGGADDITNVQWVLKAANKMKHTLTMDELLEYCVLILQHHGYEVSLASDAPQSV